MVKFMDPAMKKITLSKLVFFTGFLGWLFFTTQNQQFSQVQASNWGAPCNIQTVNTNFPQPIRYKTPYPAINFTLKGSDIKPNTSYHLQGFLLTGGILQTLTTFTTPDITSSAADSQNLSSLNFSVDGASIAPASKLDGYSFPKDYVVELQTSDYKCTLFQTTVQPQIQSYLCDGISISQVNQSSTFHNCFTSGDLQIS